VAIHLGHIARREGDLERATASIEEAVELPQVASEPVAAVVLNDLGSIDIDTHHASPFAL
jgi:hypothetical protein